MRWRALNIGRRCGSRRRLTWILYSPPLVIGGGGCEPSSLDVCGAIVDNNTLNGEYEGLNENDSVNGRGIM